MIKMTIGNRLLFLVLGVVACQLTTAAVQVTLSSKETALQNTIDSEITAMRAKLDAFDKSRNGIVNFTWTALSAQNPEAQNAALALQAKQYLSFQENSKGLDFFQKYDPKIAELEQDLKKWETELKSAGLLNSWSAASQPDRMQKMWSNVVPISRKLDSDSFEIHDELNKKEAQFRSSLQSIQATSNTLNWFAPLVAILIIIAQAAMQIRSIQNFLERITSALGGLGDQVSNSSHSLSDSASSLSAGAVQNAASLEETVSSLEELSSMVERNADNSRQASMLAQTSRRTAETGASDISSLIESIHGIANQSTKIEEIISVIDGISFQTNLLALNAAVEAARAGEQGKGFAVVADAVRNLAQKSSEAAKDISTLIKESVEKSKMGVEQASRAGETLNRIVTDAIKVSDLITEIASASSEQAQGVGQISKAMNQLDAVTQGNAASSQQTADSSGALSENSDELKLLIGELSAFVRNDTRKLLNQKGNIAQKSTYNSPKNPSNRQNFKSTAHRLTTNEVKNSGQRSSTLARSPGTTHSRPASANLVGVIRKSSNPPSNAAQVIPFDSDDFDENNGPEAKLGNASGF